MTIGDVASGGAAHVTRPAALRVHVSADVIRIATSDGVIDVADDLPEARPPDHVDDHGDLAVTP